MENTRQKTGFDLHIIHIPFFCGRLLKIEIEVNILNFSFLFYKPYLLDIFTGLKYISFIFNLRNMRSFYLLLFTILTISFTACQPGNKQQSTHSVEQEQPATSGSDFNLTEEEKADGFTALFNGQNLDGWVGNKTSYQVSDGHIVIDPKGDGGGNLYTEKEYSDFIFRFEFQLTPGANNGLGIHAPLEGDAAYEGKEIQILDNTDPKYADLKEYQFHGSVYGLIPAKKGFLKPVGEWNEEEVIVKGSKIQVILNGTTIVDGDFVEAGKNGTLDGKDHPGLKRTKGHIGFLGHGDVLRFRNIRIKNLATE